MDPSKNWTDLSLTDFMDFEVYRHEEDNIAEIIVDYYDGEEFPECYGYPIRLIGFVCKDANDLNDFQILEKGHEWYLDFLEELRKAKDN